ncbi:MAG: SEC-C domain-containing protein [Deltaproteobacteria bacterium]|nr:SEC-C domain-containing protein [Deltaproteobacteria bacterium]
MPKTGRNDPCPCGSGKKYKKCCLNKPNPPEKLLWHRLRETHDSLVDQLVSFAEKASGDLALLLAAEEFFLWPDPEEDVDIKKLLTEHMPLFMPWFLFNWVYDPDETDEEIDAPALTTVAEAYAARHDKRLNSIERKLLAAANRKPFSFYEVIDCRPGRGFRLKDVFLGVEVDVEERMGSESVSIGDILFARVAQVDDVATIMGCGTVAIPPVWKPKLIEMRRDMTPSYGRISTGTLDDWDPEIRGLYQHIYDSMMAPPQLANTDGDPMLFHELYYDIDDPETAFQLLSGLSVMEDEAALRDTAEMDDKGRILRAEIPWTRKGFKGAKGLDSTLLGRILINGRKLTVEVNSQARADAIRREMQKRLREKASYKATEIQSPEALVKHARESGDDAPKGLNEHDELMKDPEVRKHMQQLMADTWKGWIDEKILALGMKTPRQAVKTADGRESVEALLLDGERHMNRDKNMKDCSSAIMEEMRRDLGLDRPLRDTRKKKDMQKDQGRVREINDLIKGYARTRLNSEFEGFALKLCDRIAVTHGLDINRGRGDIWAASIVYAIARLNFLFDPESEISLTADDICRFFGTKKSTVGNKAGSILKVCDLYHGHPEFCTAEIVDMLRIYINEDGLMIPGFAMNDILGEREQQSRLPPGKKTPSSSGSRQKDNSQEGKRKARDAEKQSEDPQLNLFEDL